MPTIDGVYYYDPLDNENSASSGIYSSGQIGSSVGASQIPLSEYLYQDTASHPGWASDTPGFKVYGIPAANSGQDNKYEYIQSLINAGAVTLDGAPLTWDNFQWGMSYVRVPESNVGMVGKAIDYNPTEDPDYGPLLGSLFLAGVGLSGGFGNLGNLFSGAGDVGSLAGTAYDAAAGLGGATSAGAGSLGGVAASGGLDALSTIGSLGSLTGTTYDAAAGLGGATSSDAASGLIGATSSGSGSLGGMLSSAAGTAGGSVMDIATSLLPKTSSGDIDWAKIASGGASALGGYLNAGSAADAAKTQADAQIRAAQIAADAAKFKPVGVTTRFGSSQFGYDANGNLTSAGYNLAPDIRAQQDQLMGMTGGLLNQYAGAQATTAPMGQAAQSMFSLGNQYLGTSPEAQAQKYMAEQQALLATGRERDMSQMLGGEFNRGTYGLSTGSTSTGMMGSNPRLEALMNAQRQQDLGLAAQATQGGMDYANFGAGMVGAGGEMLQGMYGTQSAAYNPYQTAMGGATYLEGLGQNAMDMGINIGAKGTAASAASGGLLAAGMNAAANTTGAVNQAAGSTWGNILQGGASALQNYQSQQSAAAQQAQQQAYQNAMLAKIWS
jgi:hypothetical protein